MTSSTVPEQAGDCWFCGYPVYLGLSHHCPTAPKPKPTFRIYGRQFDEAMKKATTRERT